LWQFSSSNSRISRELWVEKNELTLKNCCQRNFLLQERLKTPNVENIAEYSENFCVFPKSFVDVNGLGYTYLSDSKEKINTNEINKEKTENDILIKDVFSVKYLYYSLKEEKKQIKPREITTLLDIFNDNSIFNLNCCDLFSHIK
jgi:hypothetical protein